MQIIIEKGNGKGTLFRLHDGINTLGRDAGNRIRLSDSQISRNHCKIRKIGESLFLTDLGTRNGTSVNGKPVAETALVIGDRIAIGSTVLRIVDESHERQGLAAQPPSFSFVRAFSLGLFGKGRGRQPEPGDRDFHKLPRRGFRAVWKPPSPSDSPDSRRKTVVSTTDPD